MKLEMELNLVVKSESKILDKYGKHTWDVVSIDTCIGNNLTSLLGQFLIVIASVHNRIVEDVKLEYKIDVDGDDDIPF